MNCDGVYKEIIKGSRQKSAGIGVIIKDENGRVVTGMSKKVEVNSSLKAEATAMREGILLAEAVGIKKVVMETYSKVLFKELIKEKGGRILS